MNFSIKTSSDEELVYNNIEIISALPNQFNKGLKRKLSLKTEYEQEK